MRSPLSLALALLTLAAPGVGVASARAAALPALAGRIDGVVAAGAGLAVLRDGEAVLLDGAARVVGRCSGASAEVGRARRSDRTAIPAERLLREAGLGEEDVSPEAEALLDDEGIDAASRRRPVAAAAGMPRALALAGTAGAAWIGTADGLWRLDARAGSCARAGLGGRALALVAARGLSVVAVSDVTVWRSSDGGASFSVAAVLATRAHALTLAADDDALLATEDAVVAVGAARNIRRVLEQPADALVACGQDVIALAADGVYRLGTGPDIARVGDRPPARALACLSAAGPRLLAVGVGAWSTEDGRAWREESLGLGRSFSAVAFAAGRVWLATDDGLYASPDAAGASPNAAPHVVRPAGSARRPLHPWAWLLPRVALSFDGWTESTPRAGWRLWLLVTVTLGRRESSGVPE